MMAPARASATARIILTTCFFLPLSSLFHHVAASSPPFSFSFDFSNTSKYRLQDLRFEGDAALNGDQVDLTCNPIEYYCSGRMSYNHPVPLYDNITGEVASFVTTFTFAINLLPNTTKKGDGMTFFLSSYPSRLPPASYSGLLGLTNSSETISTGEDRFLAVEFDTYGHSWDPTGSYDHMGIDLNSITSVSTTKLPSYSLNGTMTAIVTFDNATRTLEATLQFDSNHSLATTSVKTQLPDQLDASLPPLVAVGFSAATGGNAELHQIHSWSFNSTMAPKEKNKGGVHPNQGEELGIKGRQGRGLAIGGVVILVFALMLAIWATLSWCMLKRKRDSFGKDGRIKRLEYRALSNATGRFSNANKIGEGGFGVVYKGKLGRREVAVKKILKDSGALLKNKHDSNGEFKDFLAEVGTIGEMGHMNVVRLEGWCCNISNYFFWCFQKQKAQLFIVYELVPNGNLEDHLYHREEGQEALSWARRYNIVKGLLSALYYLHHQCEKLILHRDIKPSNILLDYEFNAKLGDFGLSRAAEHNLQAVQTEAAAGTKQYMDPLSMKDGTVNLRPSSDVYSFGLVLLEIAHGKFDPVGVRKLHTNKPETFVNDVADVKLDGKFNRAQMERVIVLGLRCSEPDDESKRPSLNGAILHFLENGGELPRATLLLLPS